MKKIIGILAVAATMFIACDKEQKQGGNPADYNYDTPKLPAPQNQENHFGMTVNQAQAQDGMHNPDGVLAKVTEVNVPPGNTGTVEFDDGKGPREFNYTVSKVAGGTSFLLDNVFEKLEVVSVDGKNVSLVATLENLRIPLNGTLQTEPPYTPYIQDVCRDWEVVETILSVTGDGIAAELGVGKKFDGCALTEISHYLVDKGVKIQPLSQGYDVKKILIDPAGKFSIFFWGADPYSGNFTLKGTSFSYDFKYFEDDNPLLSGKAIGKLTVTNGFGRLEVKSEGLKDSSGKKYQVNAIFKLKTAEKQEYIPR